MEDYNSASSLTQQVLRIFIPLDSSPDTLSTLEDMQGTLSTNHTRHTVRFSLTTGISLTVNFLVGDVSVPTLSSLKLLNSGFSIHLDKRDSYLQLSGDKATLHYDQTGLLRLPTQLFTDLPHPLPPEALQSQQDEAPFNAILQARVAVRRPCPHLAEATFKLLTCKAHVDW